MKIFERILASILILGGFGHAVGSYLNYRDEPVTLLWALSASMFSFLVAAINLLRSARHRDRSLAWIAFAGSLALAASAFTFGFLIGNGLDLRALGNGITALMLAVLNLQSALQTPDRRH